MAGSWASFTPPSSVGSFAADTMLLLTDGSVLIHDSAGNYAQANNWLRLSPDSSGNYQSGTWSSLISMANTRQFFSSAALMDGRVYALGGEYSDAGGDTPLGEIFDPQTNHWSPLSKPSPSFDYIKGDASGAVLPDGRVLLGNLNTTSPPFKTAIWDPATDDWTTAGSAFGSLATDTKTSNCNEETWTLLGDGSVLAVETFNEPNAARYVASIDEWVSAGSTPSNLVLTTKTDPSGAVVNIFEIGPAVLLPDGRVFAIGATGQTALYTPAAAGSDPTTNPGAWAAGPAFPADTTSGAVWPTLTVSDGPAVLQTNGKVLCVAGNLYESNPGTSGADYFSQNMQFFEFDPSDNSLNPFSPAPFTAASAPNTWVARFLLLPTGQIMLTTQGSTIYIYTPDAADNNPRDAWRPTISSCPDTLVTGHTYTITGTQFNGLSQAVSYGDDAQTATNFPIVALSNSSGDVAYLRTFDFSTMAVATGATPVSTEVEVPPSVAPGAWQLNVIANGIASQPVDVEVVSQDCFFILDRDTYGEGEIQAMINLSGAPATVDPALYVVVEGFTAGQLGLTSANLSSPPHAPQIPAPATGISAVLRGPVLPEDASLPAGEVQRFTFPYALQFTGASVFAGAPRAVTVHATLNVPGQSPASSQAVVHLIASPDPFIVHGDEHSGYPWWLSTDVRVFQVTAGATRFGATVATSGSAQTVATTFIQSVIQNLNSDPAAADALFEGISQDEDVSALNLLPTTSGGTPVYNFALARVRLQDVASAANVGVFFRLYQAQQTAPAFNTNTIYRQMPNPAGHMISLLGIEGDEIVTIPFFAAPRINTNSVSMSTQIDAPNRHAIAADPLGAERHAYYGCWLDINQPNDLRFPDRMVGGNPTHLPDGPFTGMGTLLSIQQLVRATHQCLIAQVHYAPDPPSPGSDPSNSDKLAQRNLTLVGAPNPGTAHSRRVPQTLEIRPTPAQLAPGLRADELMFEWGETPDGTTADLYFPSVDAADVLDLASSMYATHRLSRLDAHTIRMQCSGVSYVPVPAGTTVTRPGLLTVNLPQGIRRGQQFDVLVKQLTSASVGLKGDGALDTATSEATRGFAWRRVAGVFNLQIPVATKRALLPVEEQTLSVMRWIGRAIPVEDRWYLVFQRYLSQLAGRVRQMGGDPGQILPSPTGGIVDGHGGEPGRGDRREVTGKVEGLLHDRFGDFEGFVVRERHSGEVVAFRSRESGIAELAREAWELRITVSVLCPHHDRERPEAMVLRSPPR